ncbi:hypothetical protein UB51_03440 [Paenibacillus sp. IHBB 10380]|nr:hypothetical protein UB51_03440 [Paenibacillus sp. IHBB 10380]
MYPMNIIWLIAVIGFAIYSAIGNKNKPKQGDKTSGMPTFGGPREVVERPARSNDDKRDEYPSTSSTTMEMDDRHFTDVPEYHSSSSSEYESGEGVSQMWQESSLEDSMEGRQQMMQNDINRVTAALDKIAGGDAQGEDAYRLSDDSLNRQSEVYNAEHLRTGVVWAEILGPPRAKRAYVSRKL